MLLKLAWRNIWRNKRRTYITSASIMFAVFFSSSMEALQKGAWDNLISNVVNFYYGYVQVHQDGYWEEQTLDKAFALNPTLEALPETVRNVEAIIPRIESFALASSGEQTMGTLVIGIDPPVEHSMTDLENRLVEGTYLNEQDKAVLIASGVGERLKLSVGDTLVLISQGYHGANAAGKYPVKGIVKFGSPELNKQMVYMPLAEAQWFYGAENLLTSLAFRLKNADAIPETVKALAAQLPADEYEVMDWEMMIPDLVEARALDSGGNVVVYIILYMIIAFGIFGTILMMTKERSYEFGVLVAIGMHRWRLSTVIWLEIVLLGILGALFGVLISLPVVYYFNINPLEFAGDYSSMMEKFGFEAVFPAAFRAKIFLTQALIVFVLTAILGLFPYWKIRKLEPVQAMRA